MINLNCYHWRIFWGGAGGAHPPNFIRAPPNMFCTPPTFTCTPPNIFAPYPRNYSIRGQAAYVPPNYSFLQLQTTPVLTFLMLSGTFKDSRRPIFAPPDPPNSSGTPPNNIALDPPLIVMGPNRLQTLTIAYSTIT